MENKNYSRRKFISKCLNTSSMFFGGALFLNSCNTNKSNDSGKKQSTSEDPCDDLSGVSEEELKKRQSLGYVSKSPVPGSFCGNCSLYIPSTTENSCGSCLLFKGPVHAEGHCAQYSAKVQ